MGILRDLALILLALEAAIGSLIGVILLAVVHYALYRSRWWQVLPRYLLQAHRYLILGRQGTERISRKTTAPIFAVASAWAALTGILRWRKGL